LRTILNKTFFTKRALAGPSSERLEASSDLTARDQASNIVGTFISVEALHVQEMLDNLILKEDSIASHALSGKRNYLTSILGDLGFASGSHAHGHLVQVYPLAKRY
jgi:hypothetical protein